MGNIFGNLQSIRLSYLTSLSQFSSLFYNNHKSTSICPWYILVDICKAYKLG